MQFFSYWFWPNPSGWYYSDVKVMGLLAFCLALVVLSFAIGVWRKKLKNPVTKKLSGSWSTASFWFGITGAVFVVCRVESIQFLAMRAMWGFWMLAAILYIVFQVASFRKRHYTVVDRVQVLDERDKYLPRKK